ncbi:MAG: hypothetical protein IPJ88_01055 [Myxococcales bacterium]|nr:MAG: hypothetical protein IPJ88_01055 [Myxococcales bacterium]
MNVAILLLVSAFYIRDYVGELIPASRVMLHAYELEFEHPKTGRRMNFQDPAPFTLSV